MFACRLPLLLVALAVTMLATSSAMSATSRSRRSSVQDDPDQTRFEDDCPNGYIAWSKFNTKTGVFDCAIKTAEICFVLCDTVASSNWDISNPTSIMDPTEQTGWYCRALPGYPTRPCFYKPLEATQRDVEQMLAAGNHLNRQ